MSSLSNDTDSKILEVPCKTLEIPCLGRLFELGGLYDIRDDRLQQGICLWKTETLKKAPVRCLPNPSTNFTTFCDDSLQKKVFHINLNGSLQLSALSKLIDIHGSASLLFDKKTTKHTGITILKFRCTTETKQVSMELFDKIEYSKIFASNMATHVVTSITYGAELFLVFRRNLLENESKQEVNNDIKFFCDKIPDLIKFGVEGRTKFLREHSSKIERFECTFHGNVCLSKELTIPRSYEAAVDFFSKLTQLVNDKEFSLAPVTAEITPLATILQLSKLSTDASYKINEVSTGLVYSVVTFFDELSSLEVKGTEINQEAKCNGDKIMLHLSKHVEIFLNVIHNYRSIVEKLVKESLPEIRGSRCAERDSKLTKFVTEVSSNECLLSYSSLLSILKFKENEIRQLRSVLLNFQAVAVKAGLWGDLEHQVLDHSTSHAFCLSLPTSGIEDTFLCALMQEVIRSASLQCQEGVKLCTLCDHLEKFPITPVETSCLKTYINQFKEFFDHNKKEEYKYFISQNIDGKNECGIYLITSGKIRRFSPPGKPGKPVVQTLFIHDQNVEVSLKWDIPEHGADEITGYSLLKQHKLYHPSKWENVKEIHENCIQLTLNKRKQYYFAVRSNCLFGAGLTSDPSECIEPSKLPSEPRDINVTRDSCRVNLKWTEPNHGARHVKLYRVLYSSSYGKSGVKKLPKYEQTDYCFATIDVQPGRMYSFCVIPECKCGFGVGSRWTDPIPIVQDRFCGTISPLMHVNCYDSDANTQLRSYYVPGKETVSMPNCKVILLIDNEGSGRLDAFINILASSFLGTSKDKSSTMKIMKEREEEGNFYVYHYTFNLGEEPWIPSMPNPLQIVVVSGVRALPAAFKMSSVSSLIPKVHAIGLVEDSRSCEADYQLLHIMMNSLSNSLLGNCFLIEFTAPGPRQSQHLQSFVFPDLQVQDNQCKAMNKQAYVNEYIFELKHLYDFLNERRVQHDVRNFIQMFFECLRETRTTVDNNVDINISKLERRDSGLVDINASLDVTDIVEYAKDITVLDYADFDVNPANMTVRKNALYEVMKNTEKQFAVYSTSRSGNQLNNEKVVILIGASCSGKSTLINYIANFLLGVKVEDKYYYEVTAGHKGWMSAYTFHPTDGSPRHIQYAITIIDTPGLGDIEDQQQNFMVFNQIKEFLALLNKQIDDIIVVSKKSVCQLNLFMKVPFSNRSVFVTHSKKSTLLITTDKNAKRFCLEPVSFFFDCSMSGLARATCEDRQTWNIAMENFENFCDQLRNKQNPMSLETFIEEHIPRALECSDIDYIAHMRMQIDIGVSKLAILKRKLMQRKHITYNTVLTKINKSMTICLSCNRPCPINCSCSTILGEAHFVFDKIKLDDPQICSMCPYPCPWSKHVSIPYTFDVKMIKSIDITCDSLPSKTIEEEIYCIHVALSHLISTVWEQQRHHLAGQCQCKNEIDYINLLIIIEEAKRDSQIKPDCIAVLKMLKTEHEFIQKTILKRWAFDF